jgi:hypothetical protein
MSELEQIEQFAIIRLAEIDIKKGDPLFEFAVQVWVNGYLQADQKHKQANDFANTIEGKIKDMLK